MKSKQKRWDYPGELISIGRISEIVNIPVSTLRYYDEIDLFKPAFVDENNNYRYYYTVQLYDLTFIEAAKDQGFSLKEIKMIISNDSLDLLMDIYKKKEDEIKSRIIKLKTTLDQIINNKGNIEQYNLKFKINKKDIMKGYVYDSIEIYLKKIPSQHTVFIKNDEIDKMSYESFAKNLIKIKDLIKKKRLKTGGLSNLKITLYGYEFNYYDCEIMEFSLPLNGTNENKIDYIKQIPDETVLSHFHYGSFYNIIEKISILHNFIKENNLSYQGRLSILMILHSPVTIDENKFVTEIQIPIKI
jgi:DNA-binding transcriptional MerR regulator/effector-binding domain-containing protein